MAFLYEVDQSNETDPVNCWHIASPMFNDSCTTPVEEYTSLSDAWMCLVIVLYSLICLVGIVGNGLVIYVVARYAKMRSVTNVYIVNLASADCCFLVGLPMLIVTAIKRMWIFGRIMCKIYMILTSVNWFASVFTLTVLSADRYCAVCHAVGSMGFRTEPIALLVCAVVWAASLVAMIPVMMFTETVESSPGAETCSVDLPDWELVSSYYLFMWYVFVLAYALPVALICIFYALVLIRIRRAGPAKQTDSRRKSNRKVTQMVFTVITVYVLCWAPYYIHQMTLLHVDEPPKWTVLLYQFLTILTYSNSALNPLLYAFLSENFRQSFLMAFKCSDSADFLVSSQMRNSTRRGRTDGRLSLTSWRKTRTESEKVCVSRGSHGLISQLDDTTKRNTECNGSRRTFTNCLIEVSHLPEYEKDVPRSANSDPVREAENIELVPICSERT